MCICRGKLITLHYIKKFWPLQEVMGFHVSSNEDAVVESWARGRKKGRATI